MIYCMIYILYLDSNKLEKLIQFSIRYNKVIILIYEFF